MKPLKYWQLGVVAGFLLVYTIVSLTARRGFALTAFFDISAAGLWLIAIVAMVWAALSNHGRTRWFWFLLASGAALVGTNLGAWLYYEVIRGRSTPDPFWADIPLFLQPVPMMVAAAMRPGSRQREENFHLSTLNFLILLLWWVYIYMFLVYPNEYIVRNRTIFDIYYYSLFVLEFGVMLAVLGGMALVAEGEWREIYWDLFFAFGVYLAAVSMLEARLGRGGNLNGSDYRWADEP